MFNLINHIATTNPKFARVAIVVLVMVLMLTLLLVGSGTVLAGPATSGSYCGC